MSFLTVNPPPVNAPDPGQNRLDQLEVEFDVGISVELEREFREEVVDLYREHCDENYVDPRTRKY